MMGLSMPKCIKIHLCAIVRPGFPKFSGGIPPDPDREMGQVQRVGRIIAVISIIVLRARERHDLMQQVVHIIVLIT